MNNSFKAAALFGIGVASIISCAYLVNHDREAYSRESQQLTSAIKPVVVVPERTPHVSIVAEGAIPPSTTQIDLVGKWLAEASDANPAIRAAAITALATAPSSAVVPTLQRVLIAGEPMTDRPLALSSLRVLALQQGDDDGFVRDAVRQAIYDGSDENIAERAQAVLDEVEATLNKNTKG